MLKYNEDFEVEVEEWNIDTDNIRSIVIALMDRLRIDGHIADAHDDNVGTLIQDPNTYVIFDN